MTCLITGAFQLSFGVFLIFETLNTTFGVPPKILFIAYAGLILALTAASVVVWPSRYGAAHPSVAVGGGWWCG